MKNASKKNPQALYVILLFSLSAVCLILACYKRIVHTYLEDDFLWCLPLIDKINHTESLFARLVSFQGGEMSLFDGIYFSAMLTFFGTNLKLYTAFLLASKPTQVLHFDLLESITQQLAYCRQFLAYSDKLHDKPSTNLWEIA